MKSCSCCGTHGIPCKCGERDDIIAALFYALLNLTDATRAVDGYVHECWSEETEAADAALAKAKGKFSVPIHCTKPGFNAVATIDTEKKR